MRPLRIIWVGRAWRGNCRWLQWNHEPIILAKAAACELDQRQPKGSGALPLDTGTPDDLP
jgi:hypothetical protein